MTDYNDGKWHGWNGGECPVDTETMVLIQTVDGVDGSATDDPLFAGDCEWAWSKAGYDIIAFRVTKPAPPKPREYWLAHGFAYDTEQQAITSYLSAMQPPKYPNVDDVRRQLIHVREVL